MTQVQRGGVASCFFSHLLTMVLCWNLQFIKQVADVNQGTVRTAKKEVIGKPVSKQAASETRNYMISVGTDPEFGTMYNKSEGSPIIKVGNYVVAVKSGTAQVADEKTGTYKVGTNETLNSVVAMVPSDDPEYIMYLTIQEPKTGIIIFMRLW